MSANQPLSSNMPDIVQAAQVVELMQRVDPVPVPVSKAAQFLIASPEDRSVCSALLGDAKTKIKQLTEERMAMTRPLDAVKAMIMNRFRPAITFFESEKGHYELKLSQWDAEQTRLRLAEEARVRAETERLRQEAIRAAREAEELERQKAEELRREADAVVDAELQQQMLQEAAEREEQARQESAMRQEQAAMISTPVVAPAVSHIGGESQTWKYLAEEVDLDRMIAAVYERRLPKSVLMFNQVGANRLANALQEEFRVQYPEATCGVRLKKEPVYTHRKGRK